MRSIISFEITKGRTRYRLQLVPITNTLKYHALIDGELRYIGSGFRLEACLRRLARFEQEGFDVRILSRRTKRALKRFKRGIDESSASVKRKPRQVAKPPKGKTRGSPMRRSLFD